MQLRTFQQPSIPPDPVTALKMSDVVDKIYPEERANMIRGYKAALSNDRTSRSSPFPFSTYSFFHLLLSPNNFHGIMQTED